MNKIVVLAVVGILTFSCNSDKKSELIKLKKQYAQLGEKIVALEKELAGSGDSLKQGAGIGKLVKVIEIKQGVFNHFIEVQGRLDGDENVPVSALTGGKVMKIFVQVGQTVSKGELLATLDDAVLQKNLAMLEANYSFVSDVYEKKKKLWEQKIGSEVEYLAAKNNKESMENNIAAMKAQIENMKLRSPVNGSVEDISVKEGQLLMPGLPAFRVVSFQRMKVVAEVAEGFSDRISKGDRLYVLLPDINKEVIATVSFASKYINPVNRTFTVEARIDAMHNNLKANMIALLKINDYTNSKAISLPINLIQNEEGAGSYVFVAMKKGGQYVASKVPVKIGVIYNGVAEVIDGLKSGDEVISVGYLNLEEGTPIRIAR